MSNRGRHKKSKEHLIVQILGIKIANRMMECQEEQKNKPNLDVFLINPYAGYPSKGFTWRNTKEGHEYWETLLIDQLKNHYLFKKWQNERS